MRKFLILISMLMLFACSPVQTINTSSTSTPERVPSSTNTTIPTEAATATDTQTPPTIPETPTPTQAAYHVCVPLELETFESIKTIISKPLDIPTFGADTGHHGVDFSYFQRGDRDSIEGIEIYAILSGTVVVSLENDIPYGYTVLIETPLSDLPESLQETLMAGYLPVPEDPNYRLYCPDVRPPELTNDLSVYHLYAHMEIKPGFTPGDPITCGTKLGTVGNTGYSSNPHLHLETRLGPSGAAFTSMAHYEAAYTIEQLSTYCIWRMSGYYQLFDPFILFNADG